MRAIDADKLMEKARYIGLALGYTSTGGRRVRTITEDDIKAAPTITYEDLVPHGRWGALDYDFDRDEYTRPCSNCGRKTTDYGNYCPNCGAKMDGGNESE